MKSAGLPSTCRKMFRQTTKINIFEGQEQNRLAAKEKVKLLRQQAERAQYERQKKAAQAAAVPSAKTE
jgi:hypothetical protein